MNATSKSVATTKSAKGGEIMKKYELMKTDIHFWELYYYDSEFSQWVFIKGFDDKTTVSSIYNFIKGNNKNNDIIQVKILNNNLGIRKEMKNNDKNY